MRKVVFFDRDGVINSNKTYYTFRIKDFTFNPGVIETLAALRDMDYEFIIISNQSGISKGIYSVEDTETVHRYMINQLNKHSVSFLEIYYCTHHPDIEACLCRKPLPLLLEKSIARFDIDREKSYFVGDKDTDVRTAINAGIKPIKTESDSCLTDILKIITQ